MCLEWRVSQIKKASDSVPLSWIVGNQRIKIMSKTLNVSLVGFESKDQEKLVKVFEYSSNRERIYRLSDEGVEILIINGDNAAAVEQGVSDATSNRFAVVSFGRKHAAEIKYHLTPPLITSRVLRVLDQVEVVGSVNDGLEEEAVKYRYRAMVVDDSLPMREALKQELAALPVPLSIDNAEDGEIALELVAKNQYDLIFLDIVMPGIDGYEVCKAIRKMPEYKKTPIVMLSGKTSPLDEVKGIISGCNTYLTKPIVHDEFQQVIRRVVKWLDSSAKNN